MAQFITNRKELMANVIKDILPSSSKLSMLVGYFYFSGFNEIYKDVENKEIRILIGLDIEKNIMNKYREFSLIEDLNHSRGEIKKNYLDSFAQFFNETDYFDNESKQNAFRLFIEKIKNGSLEIRKTLHPNHAKLYLFENKDTHNQNGHFPGTMITGSSNLTRSGLVDQHEINVLFRDENYIQGKILFDELWKDAIEVVNQNNLDEFYKRVIDKIWIDKLPKPFLLYLRVLHEYFSLNNEDEVSLPADITDNQYFNLKYQVDALHKALEIIKNHNGVIIADVVGLGKSIIASAIAYNLRKKTIIIAPPHLVDQWNDYRFSFSFNAKVYSNGKLDKALLENNTDEEKLVIIDEAHKYRNEFTNDYGLLHQLCQGNKVVLLSATPFNNRPQDIFSMIKFFQIPTKSTIQTVDNLALQFVTLIAEYKRIQKEQKSKKISANSLSKKINELSEKIRDILNPIIIRRSRLDLETIEDYKNDLKKQKISFSTVHDPEIQEYNLGDLSDLYMGTLEKIQTADKTEGLKCARYKPANYLNNLEDFKKATNKDFGDVDFLVMSQSNLADFMKKLLVRRFESSIYAFRSSLDNMIKSFENIKEWYEKLGKVPIYKKGKLPDIESLLEEEGDDINSDLDELFFEDHLKKFIENGLILIDKKDLNDDFIVDLKNDIELLNQIKTDWSTVSSDPKADHFKVIIKDLLKENPKRKIVIFSEFTDTANYLYSCIKDEFKVFKYSSEDATNKNKQIIRENFDASYKYEKKNDYDVLIATDAISEGYNLHRAGIIFNYDIPYNPTRVIQRVGRINRIDKKVFDELFIYNYFPTNIGEQETRTRQISTLKLAVIQAVLGEDTRILTSDEDLKSFYTAQYQKENQKNEQISWDAFYLDYYNKIKISHPDLLDSAINLPFRTRIRRENIEKEKGVIVFGKKGEDFTFKFAKDDTGLINLNAKDAIKVFEALITEEPYKNSPDFENVYQHIKKKLFIKKTEVPHDKGRRLTIDKLHYLKMLYPQYKDYIEDLISVVNSLDALPDYFAKLIRDLSEKSIDKDFEIIRKEIPHHYLVKILKKANEINEGKELLILAEEIG